MSKQSLGNTIRHGTKWSLFGRINEQVMQFAFGVVLARILVPADFGMLVTIQIFTGVAGFVSGGGMGQALVQAKEVERRNFDVVFTVQLVICSLIYAFFFLISPWVAVWFNNDIYTNLMRVSAINFLTRPFGNIPRSMLHREMRFKTMSLIQAAGIICSGAASVIMALNHMGSWSLIYGGLAGSASNIILLSAATRWHPRLHFNINTAKKFGAYGFKLSANEIIVYLRLQTGNFTISRFLGPSMLGLFNKADSIGKLPVEIISGSAYQTVFRALSKIQDNDDQSKYVFLRTITLVTVYTFPVYVGLWWLADPFILLVYGKKWMDSAYPLKILALGGLFRCITSQSGAVSAACNQLGYEIRIQAEAWMITIAGCLIGLRWGLIGVAWAMTLCNMYMAARMSWFANRIIKGRFWDLIEALKPAMILNMIMFAVFFAVHLLLPAGISSGKPLVYLAVMAFAGVFVYSTAFLFLPIPALTSEALRWKKTMRLASD